MSKIVIVIEGGCLQHVLCDDPLAEVTLLDFDNAKGENEIQEDDSSEGTAVKDMEHELEIAQANLTEVY
jgi:hypothetical protein